MVMLCPEGVQNKCPGGYGVEALCPGGDTLICVISRGVQLFYGIAQCVAGGKLVCPVDLTKSAR